MARVERRMVTIAPHAGIENAAPCSPA